MAEVVRGDEIMKKQKEESEVPDVRSDVGVRNPFPLAEAILLEREVIKSPIRWSELSAEEARDLLEKAFDMPYSQLFDPDPEYQSPLYERPASEREA
jgi:hypothetical protein